MQLPDKNVTLTQTPSTEKIQQLDVEQLIEELTLEEKISLLAGMDFWHTVPIERLNIPSIRVSDGPNGIRGTKFFNSIPSNCFPCGTGLAATFNKDLLVEAGELMGKEAKMKGAHVILGPTSNIVRSPLGGRAFESYSEDPLLSGHAAASVIKGIQNEKVVACLKHFVCNDQEEDRRCVDTLLTDRSFREIYLKPFHIALRDANPGSIMTAYNKVNGVHVSESKAILQGILRNEWKWDGCTMSDWYGTYSTKDSLDAGLNLEMPGPTRFRQVLQTVHQVQANLIHPKVIDDNVRQVLKLINQGLKAGIPADVIESPNNSPESSKILRKVGDESIVLLKNEESILPLSKTAKETIAVIGPNAKASQDSGGGSASLTARYKTTPYGGIEEKVKEGNNSIKLEYALGAFLDKNVPDSAAILESESGEKGLITARFYHTAPGTPERKPFDELSLNTTRIFLNDFKSDNLSLEQLLYYADFSGYFTPEESSEYEFGCSTFGSAQVFVDGKLVVDNKTKQVKGDAFFLAMGTREERGSIYLEKGKKYLVKVEFGTSPTYTLANGSQEPGGVYFGVRIKSSPEDELAKAVKVAKSADKVVLVVGLSKEWESEGFDRPDMDIPGYTNKLVEEVAKVNPNIIVINQSGSPVTLPWVDKTKALVHAWYGGNELGNTIADVLFGDYNPSGKLSVSFPKRLEDNPSFVNFGSNKGQVWYGEDVFVGYRFYEKVGREVLFPFGFGLSYTSFDFKNLKVGTTEDSLVVKVDVTNTGKVDGAEAVQLYIEQANPSINRPVKELKDFEKVFLKAGETKTVELEVSIKEATSHWNSFVNQWQSDKDTYKVLVGNSSDNILVKDEFTTKKTFTWSGL